MISADSLENVATLSRDSQKEKKKLFANQFDYLNNPIWNSNTEPLVTMKKQRLQERISIHMNLNNF